MICEVWGSLRVLEGIQRGTSKMRKTFLCIWTQARENDTGIRSNEVFSSPPLSLLLSCILLQSSLKGFRSVVPSLFSLMNPYVAIRCPFIYPTHHTIEFPAFWVVIHDVWLLFELLIVLDHCGEDGAEPEDKAFDLPVDLRSSHHLWSWTLVCDLKNWFRLWIQAAEMRVAGLTIGWIGIRRSDIQRELGVEPLLISIERNQLRWFEHPIRVLPWCLPVEVFKAYPTGGRPWNKPRTCCRDYISQVGWEHLGGGTRKHYCQEGPLDYLA